MADVLIGPVRPTRCPADDCGHPSQGRGWCPSHYARWLRTGTPTGGAGPVLAWLDPTPLVTMIDARGGAERIADPTDRRAYHRAKAAGTVSDIVADRLCCRWLRMPLENVYGLHWGEGAAA